LLDKLKRTLTEQGDDFIFFSLLTLATAVVMLQLRSLYSTPIPDSYLWWGDESWLMIEFRTQILDGVFRHPFALGSSLNHGSGFILGNMWISALLYGIPSAIVDTMDIVLLGRTITALFAFTLLIALFAIIKRATLDRHLALVCVILLVTSRSFLFTSHSARYDILNALAILIGVFVLLRLSRRRITQREAAIVGFIAAASMLVTIHVTLSLFIAAAFTVYFSSEQRWKSFGLFCGGAATFVILLALISYVRAQSSLFGSGTGGSFALNIHDIPGLRFYSRSVQFANASQKAITLTNFGLGFVIIIGVLVLTVILQFVRNRFPLRISKSISIMLLALVSWFELESAAPTSYLIYILPVLALAVALAAKRFIPEAIRMWAALPVALVLTGFAFKDMPGPHGQGYRIMTANYQAVGAALDQMPERDSGSKPLVLAFNPAVHEILRDTTVRLMTTHFIEFPNTFDAPDSVIRREGVRYVLLYRSAVKPGYMREVGPITEAASRLGTPIWERAGYFTDIGRTYFSKQLGPPDTIRLYRLHD
jgi:hypothetical protein